MPIKAMEEARASSVCHVRVLIQLLVRAAKRYIANWY